MSQVVATPMRPLRLAVIASDGGHYIQLQRLKPLLMAYDTIYFIAGEGKAAARTVYVRDFSRSDFWIAAVTMKQLLGHFWKERPDVVLTTGAAPGLLGILLGRLVGARTVWLDSIANAERLSGSGKVAKWLAHHCLTQWPAVAKREGVAWIGNVL